MLSKYLNVTKSIRNRLIKINKLINKIINDQITNEDYLVAVFNELLNLQYVTGISRKSLSFFFSKLLNYTKTINEPLALQYEQEYVESLNKEELNNRYLLGKELCIVQDYKLVFRLHKILYNPEDIPYLISFYDTFSSIELSYKLSWQDYKELLSLGDTQHLFCYLERVKAGEEPINLIRIEWQKEAKAKGLNKALKWTS